MILYLVLLGILPHIVYDFMPRVAQAKLYSWFYKLKHGYEPNLFWLQEGCPHLIIRDEKDPLRDQADVIYCNGYLYKSGLPSWWEIFGLMLLFILIALLTRGFRDDAWEDAEGY